MLLLLGNEIKLPFQNREESQAWDRVSLSCQYVDRRLERKQKLILMCVKPLNPNNDQYQISPCNMLYKTECLRELRTASHKMNLLEI